MLNFSQHPIPISTRWFTAELLEQFGGTVAPVRFSLPEKRVLKKKKTIRPVRFNTNYFKNQLAGILEIAPGDPGCWHYHSQVTQDLARQMTVEGIDEKGVWENPHERPNHVWDCAVLLLLVHEIRGVAFWRREEPTAPTPETHRRPE